MAFSSPPWPFHRRNLFVLSALVCLAAAAVAAYRLAAPYYHLHAAELALQKYDFDAAQPHLDACLSFWPDSADVHLLAARTARRRGAYKEAERELTLCEGSEKADTAAVRERALLRAQQGDLAVVEAPLRELVENNDPDAPLLLEALAQGCFLANRTPQALQDLDLLLERQPDNFPAVLWRGRILESLADDDDAVKDYDHAVSLNPYSADARLALADALYRIGRPREAVGQYECLRRRPPVSPEAILGLARCRYDLHNVEEARRLLDGLLAKHPDHVAALLERGWIALHHERPDDAEPLVRRAVKIAPFDRGAHLVLWRCLEAEGKEEEARQVQAALGKIEADQMRITNLKAQVDEHPNDAAPRREIGVLLVGGGEDQEGYRWLTSALRLDPHDPATHAALVEFFQHVGDAEAAERERRLAQQLN